MKYQLFLLLLLFSNLCWTQTNYPLTHDNDPNYSATYEEAIAHYTKLAKDFSTAQLMHYGMTDAGFPLHLLIYSQSRDFDPETIKAKNKTVILINNAIHAGESCGVDASMSLIRDLLEHPEQYPDMSNMVLLVIPVYNIGGALNRNSHTRTNQNGPKAYGFRGNAKNLDLNRDFIKCDSKNAQTFNQLFNLWEPHIFIDNHTSNGADYQYTITLISTQSEKLGGPLATFQQQKMLPELYKSMNTKGWEMTPYVFARNTPDDGIAGFLDLPRYSSGYAALHHCLSFMPETHMLKPFADRVKSTRAFSESIIEFVSKKGIEINAAKKKSQAAEKEQSIFNISWSLNAEIKDSLLFKGYTAGKKPSQVTGRERLYYDRNNPYQKWIPFFNTYKSDKSIKRPRAYIIPQAYEAVIQRLEWNSVKVNRLKQDSVIQVNMYRIQNYESPLKPYEGHFLHTQVEVKTETKNWVFHKGDYIIYTDQPAVRYIVETLEPEAPDSFFAWNFFDGILSQKEYFSSYVFEERAAELLSANSELKAEFEATKKADPEFAENARAQLQFIYERSVHQEKTVNLYPVARVE